MPRASATTVDNNFTKGLVTEFTAMNFPENAVTEGDNCVYSEQGSVVRRNGMNYEASKTIYATSTLSSNPNTYTEFRWYSAGNSGTTTFVVQQVGEKLYFFAVSTTGALSAGKKSFSIDVSTYKTSGTTVSGVSNQRCQYTFGKGYLIVVHPLCEPFYVSYDSVTDTITTTQIALKIRDLQGVDDGLATDNRPTTISNLHKYNLYNQGWGAQVKNDTDTKPAFTYWDSLRSDYPSNADIFWVYKNANGNIDDKAFNTKYLGNTPAPKGYYIYNAFNVDRTTMSGFSGLPTDTSGSARPSCVAFYAGRVFYAGVSKNKFSDKIYFSQIVESDIQIGKCYQSNDPTSEIAPDLLDSDGGVISLPLIESVVALKVVNDVLVIIGTNAIITIHGDNNGPFKATNYTVEYVSTIGGTSNLSVIEVDGGLMWWNSDAIYALAKDQTGFSFQVLNVSKSSIQTLVSDIPKANIQYVKGAYNKKDQIIQWIYSDQDTLTGYNYNRILEFNVISKAFYTHSIDLTLGPRVSGLITIGGQKESLTLTNVTDNSLVNVTNAAAALVQVNVASYSPASELFKYVVTGLISSGSSGLTYGELRDQSLVDWRDIDTVGVSYSSYGVSGYRVRGEFQRKFNSTPIIYVLGYLENGRCLVSGIWDYNFRQTSAQELYLVRPEVDYLIRRVKMRGKGKSLQLKFQSVGDAPFELIGWSTFDSGGTAP